LDRKKGGKVFPIFPVISKKMEFLSMIYFQSVPEFYKYLPAKFENT
jgi:hypothetical protein